MSDDIVTRLRKEVARAESDGVLPSWDFAKVVWEAADEIERLRIELQSYYDEDEEIRRGRSGE